MQLSPCTSLSAVAATSVISGGPPSRAAVACAWSSVRASIGGQISWPRAMSVGSWVTAYWARVGHWSWNDSPAGRTSAGGAAKPFGTPPLKKIVGS